MITNLGYQWGLRNPFNGSMNNPYMSFDEDKKLKNVNFNYCPIAA